MKFPRATRIFRGQWDALPFLSVFFLLILFLALQSRLAFVPGVAIDLPIGSGTPTQQGFTLVVAVDHVGQYYYENQVITPDRLEQRLQETIARLKSPVTLIVHADKSTTQERMVELSGLAKRAGVRDLLQATRPAPAARTPKPSP